MPQLDVFLLVLRILFIVLLYLFLMQVVIAITRDLKAKAPVIKGQLLVVDNGPSTLLSPGTRFELRPQTTIGRGPTNTIRLSDSFISTEHARMWNRNGKWYAQDAGSTYGTYVNAQPARDPVLVNMGDIIQLGPIRFKLIE
jgi:pSer/pThr/pTyr-binding forkhead associated (FHA) protein